MYCTNKKYGTLTLQIYFWIPSRVDWYWWIWPCLFNSVPRSQSHWRKQKRCGVGLFRWCSNLHRNVNFKGLLWASVYFVYVWCWDGGGSDTPSFFYLWNYSWLCSLDGVIWLPPALTPLAAFPTSNRIPSFSTLFLMSLSRATRSAENYFFLILVKYFSQFLI